MLDDLSVRVFKCLNVRNGYKNRLGQAVVVGKKHPAAEKKAEDLHMEFNLVVFFIAIALVIIAAVIATVVAVSGGVSAAVHNKLDEEE